MGNSESAVTFILETDRGKVEIDFEVDDGELIPVAFRGDADGNFIVDDWDRACRTAAAGGITEDRISRAAMSVINRVAGGEWRQENAHPGEERLGVYVAVARVIWRMAQGQAMPTAEVAKLMTRHRSQAFRFLKTIEAGRHVPLFYDEEKGTWQLLARRYLRI